MRELKDLWHVAHLQATLLAEAATAVREIGAFVRDATAHSERLRP